MIINTKEFKKLLKKATINFMIDSVQIIISKDNVKSRMITASSDAISILNVKNDLISFSQGMSNDLITLNFSEPNTSLMPFLNLINDEEETVFKLFEEKITLVQGKQKSNIFFCSPFVVNIFGAETPREDVDYITSIPVDETFINEFNKIKKIGSKFNKIYLGVEENVLFIETSDRQNRFSNGLRIDIQEVNFDDMNICFDFKNFVNTMNVIDDEFIMKIAYVKEQNLGMVHIKKNNDEENFYLMSKLDA